MAKSLSVEPCLVAVLTNAQEAILFLREDGDIISCNPAAERLFGSSQAEMVGNQLEIIMPPSSRSELARMVDAVRSGQQQVRRELTCSRSDGSPVQVEMSLAAVRDHGRDIGLVLIAHDITERQRVEHALRHSEKMAATGRLAALIAHEINNPLESVTNLLYLLEHHPGLDERARQYVSMATEELARVVHITRQTLGFYREASAPVPIRISELLENVLELYAHRLQARHIRVEKRFGPEPEIRGFPGEMRQVFSNLLVNALEAVGEGGELKLYLYESHDWRRPERRGVRVVIADNGPGIAPEHRRHIFEPFYTTKGERGTGLGLWVSRGIIHKYGGLIRVRSSIHPRWRGTAFSVFLPAHREENLANAA
jgi:PAS domain S-box-containing protein